MSEIDPDGPVKFRIMYDGLTAEQARALDEHYAPGYVIPEGLPEAKFVGLTEKGDGIQVLESFYEEDYPGEQKEQFDKLKKGLDEDRMSDRKLFAEAVLGDVAVETRIDGKVKAGDAFPEKPDKP
jgi:hypothetical protein